MSAASPVTKRSVLTPDQVTELSCLMKEQFHWSEGPRPFQLDGVRAQIEGIDTIIQAPTGSGKTGIAAGPYVWPGNEKKTTIMVSPLLALEEEMVGTFKTEFGLPAVAVNSQSDPQKLRTIINVSVRHLCTLEGILRSDYRIILISPEMLQSTMFKERVLKKQEFTQNILSIVLDEAHCLSHWGADFRKHYNSLGTIRGFLPPNAPIIAVTATLTARVRRDLQSKLLFKTLGTKYINVGNDRPNVSIVVRSCEHPQNTLRDLDFIIPSKVDKPQDIPKTYVYVERIETGNEIIEHLEALLAQRNASLATRGLIRPFNATMSAEYRKSAMQAFRGSGIDNTDNGVGHDHPIRVLVCTDAAGMGCNIPDIDIVVQWKLPKKLSNFIQRAGRVARGRNRTGIAILIVERTAYSTDIQTAATISAADEARSKMGMKGKSPPARQKKTSGKKAAKGYAVLHGLNRGCSSSCANVPLDPSDQPPIDPDAEDEGLLAFVQSTTCRRDVWRQVYACPAPGIPTTPCCDLCDPSLLDHARPPHLPRASKKSPKTQGLPDMKAQKVLEEWRVSKHTQDYMHAPFAPSAILDDETIAKLTSVGSLTRARAKVILQDWLWRTEYEAELCDLLSSLEM
ncbi:P-loop containing nucleoside triphosphate hydrolase protein, partial [Daedalea quercina L-15889]